MSFHSKQDRFLGKNRKPLTSSTNTRDSLSRKQKSYSKKDNSSALPNQYLMNRSIGQRPKKDGEDSSKSKDAFSEKYYDKYHKKQKREQFPNISIIEQKESIISINQENSLDSLNNFIIQGNHKQSSVKQKSNESSSYEQPGIQDWTFLQNEYNHCVNQINERIQQTSYLNIVNALKFKQLATYENQQQSNSLMFNITQKIRTLQNQISNLKRQNKKKSINEQSSEILDNIGASRSYNQQKSLTLNEKSLQLKTSNEILQKSQTALQRQESLQQNTNKLKIKLSQDSNNKNHTSDRLLVNLEEQQQNKEYIEEQSPSAHFEETEKQQEEFIKYMNKEDLQDNQPNLSLNNISKIMGVRPKELHNKSIENQNYIKEKQDDEVVAMLENQLRGKQIVIIPQTEQTQILLKQSRDNLCLNELESDIQNNLHTSQIQEDLSDENKKNFFIALQARQKWIKSLQKDEKWKIAELALLSKMKKILHNPYIEFPQQ